MWCMTRMSNGFHAISIWTWIICCDRNEPTLFYRTNTTNMYCMHCVMFLAQFFMHSICRDDDYEPVYEWNAAHTFNNVSKMCGIESTIQSTLMHVVIRCMFILRTQHISFQLTKMKWMNHVMVWLNKNTFNTAGIRW